MLQTPRFIPRLISSYRCTEGKSLETLGGLYHWIPVSDICWLQSDWRTELRGCMTIKWCGKKATWTVGTVRRLRLASPPGLVAPVFIACSANMGEGLVKLSHMQWCIWTCGGVAHSLCTAVKQLSESKKHRQDCLMSSAQSFYGPCLRIGSTLAYLLFFWECATLPHVQVRHCTWLSFTRPSAVLVLQVTNTGVRRPGSMDINLVSTVKGMANLSSEHWTRHSLHSALFNVYKYRSWA